MARTDSLVVQVTGAYVDPASGQTVRVGDCVNRVGWDGVSPYPGGDYNPPAGCILVPDTGQPLWAPPPPVPESVAMWQLKVALSGLPSKVGSGQTALADANAAASAAGGVAEITWTGAATVARGSPLLNAMAPQIGFQEADLDALFTAAAQVVA